MRRRQTRRQFVPLDGDLKEGKVLILFAHKTLLVPLVRVSTRPRHHNKTIKNI